MLELKDLYTETKETKPGEFTSIALIMAKQSNPTMVTSLLTETKLKEYLINKLFGDIFHNVNELKFFTLSKVKKDKDKANVTKAFDRILKMMDYQV